MLQTWVVSALCKKPGASSIHGNHHAAANHPAVGRAFFRNMLEINNRRIDRRAISSERVHFEVLDVRHMA